MVFRPGLAYYPIYVASTLPDMRAEREFLHTLIFPKLVRDLAELGIAVSITDYRRALEVLLGEQASEGEGLIAPVVLSEAQRREPIWIVLIGDHYGRILARSELAAAALPGALSAQDQDCSLIEMEVRLRLKLEPVAARKIFFYIRESLPYEQLSSEVASQHRDPSSAARMDRLRNDIVSEFPGAVRRYQVRWDREREKVTGLEQLGEMVLDDLRQTVAIPSDGSNPYPAGAFSLEAEDEYQDSFSSSELQSPWVMDDVLEPILGFVDSVGQSGQPWGLAVIGPSGVGKTRLLVELDRRLADRPVWRLTHWGNPGAMGSQLDQMLRRWLRKLPPNPLAAEAQEDSTRFDLWRDTEKLAAVCVERLRQAVAGQPAVLIIDGLDLFEATERLRRLDWLPRDSLDRLRLVFSSGPGALAEAILARPDVTAFHVPPLSQEKARLLLCKIWEKYGYLPQEGVWEVLWSKKTPADLAAWHSPLWVSLVGEYLGELSLWQDPPSENLAVPWAPRRIDRETLFREACEIPGGIDRLCGYICERCESRFGLGWTQALLLLVALSRRGLREPDLAATVPKVVKLLEPAAAKRGWDELYWAWFRRGFPGWWVQHRPWGTWDFRHPLLRSAVLNRYGRDLQLVQRLHNVLGFHLRSLPEADPLRQTELLLHTIEGDDRVRVAGYLSSEMDAKTRAEVVAALVGCILSRAAEVPNPVVSWLGSLLLEPQLRPEQILRLSRLLTEEVLPQLRGHLDPANCRRLLEGARRPVAELAGSHPGDAVIEESLQSLDRLLKELA